MKIDVFKMGKNFISAILILTMMTGLFLPLEVSAAESFEEEVGSTFALSASEKTMNINESYYLISIINGKHVAPKTQGVTWSSSNSAVAYVDERGNVYSKGTGVATITAKTAGGEQSATCKITVTTATGVINRYNDTGGNVYTDIPYKINPIEYGYRDEVLWISADDSIATVDEKGVVVGKKEGLVEIWGFFDDFSTYVNYHTTVKPSCYFEPSTLTCNVNSTFQTNLKFKPANTTNKTTVYESSNTSVATVNAYGLVTCKSQGTATIKATANGYSTTCTIKVVVPVASVTLSQNNATVDKGDTFTLTATVLPANADDKTVKWTSDNTSVATVDSTGKVKTVGNGTAVITATTNDGSKTSSCTVTVKTDITGISLSHSETEINKDETFTLIATILPDDASNKILNWHSSNTSVALVNNNGEVTAIGNGVATITVTGTGNNTGKNASCTVTVTTPVTGITLSEESLKLNINEEKNLIATVFPATASNQTVTWSSSDPAVATVDDNGKITAVENGTANIAVTTQDGNFTAICKVEIITPVTGITLTENKLDINVNEQKRLYAEVLPQTASNKTILWYTSNEEIVKVDQNGNIFGLSEGTASITAKTADGNFTETCTITVAKFFKHDYISVHIGNTETIELQNEGERSPFLIWSSDNENVASVDINGKITAKQNGYARITAKTISGKSLGTCRVTVYTDIPTERKGYNIMKTDLLKGAHAECAPVQTLAQNTKVTIIGDTDGYYLVRLEEGTKGYLIKSMVANIELSDYYYSLEKDTAHDISARVAPGYLPTDVEWYSDNEEVAIVNEFGEVSGVEQGFCHIYAVAEDGVLISYCKLTVFEEKTAYSAFLKEDINLLIGGNEECAIIELLPAGTELSVIGVSKDWVYILLDEDTKGYVKSSDFAYLKIDEYINVEHESSKEIELSSNVPVIYSSNNPFIASVDQSGTVKGIMPGVAFITATGLNGKIQAVCKISVYEKTEPRVCFSNKETALLQSADSVSVTEKVVAKYNEITVIGICEEYCYVEIEGETYFISAADLSYAKILDDYLTVDRANTVKPKTETKNATLIWSSSDPEIATVNAETGIVKGVSHGEVTITAKALDGRIEEKCKVAVCQRSAPVVYIVNKSTALLNYPDPKQTTGKIISQYASATVVGVSGNYYYITLNGSCYFVPKSNLSYAEMKDEYYTLELNKSGVLSYTKENVALGWSSSDPSVATVNAYGEITGKKEGTAVITATGLNGKIKIQSKVSVCTPIKDGKIITANTSGNLTLGARKDWGVGNAYTKNKMYKATAVCGEWYYFDAKQGFIHKDNICSFEFERFNSVRISLQTQLSVETNLSSADQKKLKWSSSDPKVATVSSTGVITGKKEGWVKISVSSKELSIEKSCYVSVYRKFDQDINITVKEEKKLHCVAATNVVYRDTLQKDSKVTAIGQSGELLCVKYGNELKYITQDKAPYVELQQYLSIEAGYEYTLPYTANNISANSLIWKSSTQGVATVDSKGRIKGLKEGFAIISVYDSSNNRLAYCYVSVFTRASAGNSSGVLNAPTSVYYGAAPICQSKTASKMPTGTEVTLYGQSTSWLYVGNRHQSGIYVPKENVSFIKPSESYVSIKKGGEIQAPAIEQYNVNDSIVWSSEDTSIATITASGKIKAVKQGYVLVKAMAKNNSRIYAYVGVTVYEDNFLPYKAVAVANTAICAGGNERTPEIKKLSANQQVTVSGQAAEWFKVTASGASGYIHKDQLRYIEVDESFCEISYAGSYDIKTISSAKWHNLKTSDITYTSGNENIATVSAAGEITPVSDGFVWIRLKAYNGLIETSVGLTIYKNAEHELTAVTKGKVWGYQGSSTVTPALKQSAENTRVEVLRKSAAGYYVKSDNPKFAGYVHRDNLLYITMKADYFTIKNGTSSTALTATAHNFNQSEIKWSSENTNIFTVNEKTGEIKAKKEGRAYVCAKARDGKIMAKCMVSVYTYVGDAEGKACRDLNLEYWQAPPLNTLKHNEKVTVRGSCADYYYVISQDGKRKGYVKKDKIFVPVTSIELSQTSISLKSNKNVTLKATVNPSIATEKTVRWASRNPDIVQINSTTGEMKAVGNGSAVIVAIATDGTNKFASCTVEATVLVSDFWFDYDEHTMYHYQYMQMGYTWTPWNAKNPSLSWKSSDKAIATVDQNGTVYSNNGIWNGSARITGTTVDGSNITRSFLVHVKEAFVEEITLSPSSLSLNVGNGCGLSWTMWPSYAANKSIWWSSSNESVATVNGGWVTAKGAGTCTITATTYLGYSASCTVTVKSNTNNNNGGGNGGGNNNNPSKPNVKVTGVSLNASKKTIDTSDSFTLKATISPKNATNKTVTWSTSNNKVATVDGNGKVKGIKAGTATITVKTNDGSKTAKCIVSITKSQKEIMEDKLSEYDKRAGVTVKEINGEWYLDYTVPVLNRLFVAEKEFKDRKLPTEKEYFQEYWYTENPYADWHSMLIGNMWWFMDQVNHYAPWDIKYIECWEKQFGSLRFPANLEKFIFSGQIIDVADLGNITYGYLGSALGFGDNTLRWGGGVAHAIKNKQNPLNLEPPNYGEPPEDTVSVMLGIKIYYLRYPNEAPSFNGILGEMLF